MTQYQWKIYHRCREYAWEMGDPVLGTVTAATKQQAEQQAIQQGLGTVAGVWAVIVPVE